MTRHSRYSYMVMVGHLCSDINQGGLPATLPFLIAEHGYTYTEVATLVLVTNLVSAIIQPLFGWLGDRVDRPWTMALGVFLAGCGLSMLGIMSASFQAMIVCACVSGTGVALFHPEGGNIANAAGGGRASEMAIFSVGGNIGFTIGPIVAALSITAFGLSGLAVFTVPCTICAIWILANNRRLSGLARVRHEALTQSGESDRPGAFTLVAIVAALRSVLHYGATTFIPLFFVSVLVASESTASFMLAIFSFVGIFAMLAGGRVGDRFGLRRFVRVAYLMLIPACFLLALTSSFVLAVVSVIVMGIGIDMGYSSTTTLGQSFLPNHIATASGILLGLAVSVGGITAPVGGMIADSVGLPVVFGVGGCVGIVLCIFALLIPRRAGERP